MRNRIDEIGFDAIQLFQVGDVVQDDHQTNLRDRRGLGAEHSPIIQVDLALWEGCVLCSSNSSNRSDCWKTSRGLPEQASSFRFRCAPRSFIHQDHAAVRADHDQAIFYLGQDRF